MFRFFENLVDPFPPEHPKQPPKGVYQFCRHYTQGLEKLLILMAIFTTIIGICEAMLYGMLGEIIDWLSSQDPNTFLSDQWPALALMSAFILIFMPIIIWLQSLLVHQALIGNFPMIVRWQTHRYLINQSYSFFQNEFSGRIATKVMQTALSVRESVMKLLDVLLFVSVYLITTLILIANADLRLCAPLLVWLATYIFLLRYFVPKLRQISMNQADARSNMTGRIVDSYTNIMTLKLFSHAQRESDYVKEGMNDFLNTVHPQMRLVSKLKGCVWLINLILVFCTASLGIYLWLQGNVTPGAIAISLSLAIRLTGMSHWIMWEVSALFENFGAVQDGINTISLPHTVVDKAQAKPLTVTQGHIQFTNLNFAYTPEEPVLNNFSLNIKPGEKVGIIGKSGAGKSTLLHLLLRFHDFSSGSISIDGHNIKSVQQESLRANIGVVTQDTSLLHRSIRDNIKFGHPLASEAEMSKAAKQAAAYEFIQTLADSKGRTGFDAHAGERGVTLSGGQRQRISIARVLLKNAPILILDEATSALDSEVEHIIQNNLYQLMADKTVIAIAHRLSTIAAMDRLIVLDKGKIIEEGSHEELLQKQGLYAQLWSRQSGGFMVS